VKIAFLGNFKVPYTTETHHAQALEDLGHDVLKLQEGEATADEVYGAGQRADLIVWVHTHGWETPKTKVLGGAGEMGLDNVLTRLRHGGKKVITYHLDLWHGLAREKDMLSDPYWRLLDHFFTVDPKMARWLNQNTDVKGHYLPAGVSHRECYRVTNRPKKYDIIFVGSQNYHPEWPYRQKMLLRLADRYQSRFWAFPGSGPAVRGRDLNILYGESKIVIGDTLCQGFDYPGYWSDRVYETLGRGGFLIHPRIKHMENHFVDGEHLLYYDFNDFDQLFGLIDDHLDDPETRWTIAQQGHDLVHRQYTYLQRWEEILEIVE
jgi:hypothetical protein